MRPGLRGPVMRDAPMHAAPAAVPPSAASISGLPSLPTAPAWPQYHTPPPAHPQQLHQLGGPLGGELRRRILLGQEAGVFSGRQVGVAADLRGREKRQAGRRPVRQGGAQRAGSRGAAQKAAYRVRVQPLVSCTLTWRRRSRISSTAVYCCSRVPSRRWRSITARPAAGQVM